MISRTGFYALGCIPRSVEKIVRLNSRPQEEGVLGFHKPFSLKHLVLNEFLELSESSIHFSNASGRFLSNSDEFSGDYEVFEADYPAGLCFSTDLGIHPSA